jgi:hypothetical protein
MKTDQKNKMITKKGEKGGRRIKIDGRVRQE